MVGLVKFLDAGNQNIEDLYRQELMRLEQPAALRKRLADIDNVRPFRRLYVMGCGRSGTWLLTATMSTFDDLEIVQKERPFEYFGLLTTTQSMLVMKRDSTAYQRVANIPESIAIAYIVRHPFDVLTSHNPTSENLYHVTPHRWLGEMLTLQYLVDTGRKNTQIIRYEDLVARPQEIQSSIANVQGLKVRHSIDQIDQTFKAPVEATAAMHGLRKIDIKSVNKFKSDPAKIAYLKEIRPSLGRLLPWVGETFEYDISL